MELDDLIEQHFRLTPPHKTGLHKLGLRTLKDLLFYLPKRYGDAAEVKHIAELEVGELAMVSGRVLSNKISKTYKTKIPMAETMVEDETGKIKAVWFHQAYMAKKVPKGGLAKVSGIVTKRGDSIYLANPEISPVQEIELTHHGSLFNKGELNRTPIYGETFGLSSNWIYHAIQKLLKAGLHTKVTDAIPEQILNKYHLPSLTTSLVWIHSPKKDEDALSARKRFSFEEIFFIQISRQKEKRLYKANPTFHIKLTRENIEKFTSRFPFKLTAGQNKAVEDISKDLASDKPMTRLLEGDVGSGKTAVAATITYSTVMTRPFDIAQGKPQDFGTLQVAYMAPTEILAKQHFESFINYFQHLPINIGLVTGGGCFKFPSKINPESFTNISRTQLLKWVANGEIPILIGTHALIQKTVKFKHLALAIIDEQHRFGVEQRSKVMKKTTDSFAPHLLSMTATPIPRTLTLTVYGDLDLTVLDEMPAGRKTIITEIVLSANRNKTYEEIRLRLQEGRQVYIICPRIDPPSPDGCGRASEPDPEKENAINAKSVKEEAIRLKKKVFPEYEIGVVHSKLTPAVKEKVMKDFVDGKTQILCATSVVEVGVNVPNATVIIIEGAERFGMAQLHQLRGRVLRSSHQAYCYIFSESKSEKTVKRLKALKTAKNGFELAELDLTLRGIGELDGKKQWGITDIGMEAIKNIRMVEATRTEVEGILDIDPDLSKHPLIQEKIKNRTKPIHLE
ncbi:MAG: ATP-dependent DNA helicase RecG [Candidatus Vogelbacteria bacterium]|nr:ATP-dependent DNA helicase RecG [Candidatus Vogelbacteria bacterium]